MKNSENKSAAESARSLHHNQRCIASYDYLAHLGLHTIDWINQLLSENLGTDNSTPQYQGFAKQITLVELTAIMLLQQRVAALFMYTFVSQSKECWLNYKNCLEWCINRQLR